MSDKNFENEFNSYFGGDSSLFNKLGEEKAKEMLKVLKQMLAKDEDNNNMFKISNPLQKMLEQKLNQSKDDSREPDETISTFENGNWVTKKIWRDNEGRVTHMEVMITDKPANKKQKPDSRKDDLSDIFGFGMPNPNMPNMGLPMIMGLPDFIDGNFLNFLTGSNGVMGINMGKQKKTRTLEELLQAVVEQEDYDTAALIKLALDKNNEIIAKFKEGMAKALEEDNLNMMKELIDIRDENTERIQEIFEAYEDRFED